MANTFRTLNKQKYLDELRHESPDAVMGNLMSDFNYRLSFPEIIDPCDWLHHCNYSDHPMYPTDQQIIQNRQPMFYNVKFHRMINRTDIIHILNHLTKEARA